MVRAKGRLRKEKGVVEVEAGWREEDHRGRASPYLVV
jgi:hypothetical protein